MARLNQRITLFCYDPDDEALPSLEQHSWMPQNSNFGSGYPVNHASSSNGPEAVRSASLNHHHHQCVASVVGLVMGRAKEGEGAVVDSIRVVNYHPSADRRVVLVGGPISTLYRESLHESHNAWPTMSATPIFSTSVSEVPMDFPTLQVPRPLTRGVGPPWRRPRLSWSGL